MKEPETSVSAIEDGCLCGAVRYRASGAPHNRTACHCEICRRSSAAPYVAWATFGAADFAFHAGQPARYSATPLAVRTFCRTCGTQLTFQATDAPDEIDVTICSMDQPENLAPTDQIWTSRRLPWVPLASDLPAHARRRGAKAPTRVRRRD